MLFSTRYSFKIVISTYSELIFHSSYFSIEFLRTFPEGIYVILRSFINIYMLYHLLCCSVIDFIVNVYTFGKYWFVIFSFDDFFEFLHQFRSQSIFDLMLDTPWFHLCLLQTIGDQSKLNLNLILRLYITLVFILFLMIYHMCYFINFFLI